MRYASVCSGIEAATVAWKPLGFDAAFFAEIEPFPSAVLAHHYPDVPNLGDFTRIDGSQYHGSIDILVGGTPCQSFSVAGLRGGMDDERGALALEYLKLARDLGARWVVWENVPGVLSSNGGRDFGAFLGGLAELGYGWAYRILDAQYAGVPQRRRRVFVVGYFGDWRRAAAVLFERHSMLGHSPPSRKSGEEVAGTFSARPSAGGGFGTDFECDGGLVSAPLTGTPYADNASQESRLITTSTGDVSHCLNAGGGMRLDYETETFVVDPNQITSPDNRSQPQPGVSHTLPNSPNAPIAFNCIQETHPTTDVAPSVSTGSTHGQGSIGILQRFIVRRLIPKECERRQGFPDDYTKIKYKGKPAKDGPRYKAIGNSMAVPVMRWIGQRIQIVDAITHNTQR